MAKRGRHYERVVSEVLKAFAPNAAASSGKWVQGPDGRRDLDVFIDGMSGGQRRRVLVECKDYNPNTTGPVGIAVIDALDSKRRDLNMDVAMVCSNAGYSGDAMRKAARVGIGLVSVMRKGDIFSERAIQLRLCHAL